MWPDYIIGTENLVTLVLKLRESYVQDYIPLNLF